MNHTCPKCNYSWNDDSRSVPANNRFHAIVGEIAKFTGEDFQSVKDELKYRFGYYYTIEIDGKQITVLESTAKMGKKKFAEFMKQIESFAILQGIELKEFEDGLCSC